MTVWIVSVKSESCDDFGAHVFNREPTGDELETFLRDLSPDDWVDRDGPGFRGSMLHVESYGVAVQELP